MLCGVARSKFESGASAGKGEELCKVSVVWTYHEVDIMSSDEKSV